MYMSDILFASSIPFVYDPEYRSAVDGLSTLHYKLVWKKLHPLFTHILVQVAGPELDQSQLCQDSSNLTYS